MEQNMFIRILNSEMELATGCTEPGAVALTAAEAGQALRKAGVDKAEEITVNASINIIKNAMSAGIPGTDYEGMDYAAAIGALGGDPVYLLEVMNHVPRETVEAAAALVKAGKVKVNVAQVPQKLYIEVIAKGGGHTGRAIVRDLHTNVVLVEQDGVATLDKRDTDTTAAGDTFIGGICTCLCRGLTLKESVRYASAASAIAVSRFGASVSVPSKEEVLTFLSLPNCE